MNNIFHGYTEPDQKVQDRWNRWCSIADAELKRREAIDNQVMRQVAGEIVAAEISAGRKTLATMPEADLPTTEAISHTWGTPSESYKNSQPYHNDLYPYV